MSTDSTVYVRWYITDSDGFQAIKRLPVGTPWVSDIDGTIRSVVMEVPLGDGLIFEALPWRDMLRAPSRTQVAGQSQ